MMKCGDGLDISLFQPYFKSHTGETGPTFLPKGTTVQGLQGRTQAPPEDRVESLSMKDGVGVW